MSGRAVIIGCSAGGLEALERILPLLPKEFPAPVVVVQHQAPRRISQLAELLGRHCTMPVKEADEKEELLAGHIYTAPPDYHLLVESDGTFSLTVDEEIHHARPSLDVSFEAFAEVYGPGLVGVVLTGADTDGAAGLRRIEERGGQGIVQEPREAQVSTMPEAALAATKRSVRLAISEIAPYLVSLFEKDSDS